MTATLTPDAAIQTESAHPADKPSRSVSERHGATPGRAAVVTDRSAVRVDGGSGPGLRIRPVPRSEPLSDDERSRPLPGGARLLPPDLATGVRVRRRSGEVGSTARGAVGGAAGQAGVGAVGGEPAVGAGTAVGAGPSVGAGDGASGSAPTVLRAPETVMALVATPLHAAPPTTTRSRPAHPAPVVLASTPGLGPSPEPPPTPPTSLDLRAAAKRLLGTCVEVLGGFRPVAQLRPYCAPERFDAIANRLLRPIGAGRGHGATRSSLIAARATPGRPARQVTENRIVIRRVQICDVMDGVAELAVVMARHNKVWAMTMRMERSRGRWLCMHMEVL